ncbi:MAG: SDR family NAD(P)-dependent oxidoreductase, partial [Armatimonadota bacterium]|nr:SDR family NAD(P)-dependent oxidoreductase [Armatimonadota bacterium]
MELGLRDKVVFITGGSKGIGRACALEFAREGARVAICARGEPALRAAADAIRTETGSPVFWIAGDMTKWEDAQRCVDAAAAHFGGLDVLVNCAGASPGGLLLD